MHEVIKSINQYGFSLPILFYTQISSKERVSCICIHAPFLNCVVVGQHTYTIKCPFMSNFLGVRFLKG